MKVWCIIPAFNVSRHLSAVVKAVQSVVDEVVIVNDGSSDETGIIADSLGVTVIHHPLNRGQGAALKTGTDYALEQSANYIVHFDADGQFQAEDIKKVIKPLQEGEADIVFGSRFLDSTTVLPWAKRVVIMSLARLINRWLFNIHLTDPQSGFRAFNRKAGELVHWDQDRMAHCSEILIAAHRQPLRVTEVPITVHYHEFGQRFSGGFKILRDLWLATLNHH